MHILEKQEVDKLKSIERKKEVEEGLKLAKTVDHLRKVKGEEEANLRKFRDQSLLTIKNEIDTAIVERDKLRVEVATIIQERFNAQAPIDLKEEWKRVTELRAEVEAERKSFEDRDMFLISRESQVQADKENLLKKEESVKEKEELAKKYISETGKNYETSEKLRLKTEKLHEESEKAIHQRYVELADKERDFGYKERDLNLHRESLEKDRKALENEKIHVASQQTALRTAWQNIKRLQK